MTVYVTKPGLVILNKSGKRKLTGFSFFLQPGLELVLKRNSVNSFFTITFDKCDENKHNVTSKQLSTVQE